MYICIYIYLNHCALHLKLKQHCKSTILQLKINSKAYNLGSKETKPVNPKGNQPWIFIGRTDAEAEAPILWPPDAKSWLTGKDPDAGKDKGQEEKGQQRMRWLDGFNDLIDISFSKIREIVKITRRRERLPTPAFWPGEFRGLYSPWVAKSQTQLSDFHFQHDTKWPSQEGPCLVFSLPLSSHVCPTSGNNASHLKSNHTFYYCPIWSFFFTQKQF